MATSAPLAPLAPLHALVQLVPPASPTTGSPSTSRREKELERAYILLTSLKPDAWVVHVGRPDGRWWSGAWRVADVKDLASGDISSARVAAFAQRVSRTIIQREIAVSNEGDDFRNMKLVLGTNMKKPLRLALSELDRENAARFVFEYFTRVAEDAQAHGCRILHGDIPHADNDISSHGASHPPLKRRRDQSPNNSPPPSRAISPMSQLSHASRNTGSLREGLDNDAHLSGTSQSHTRRSRDRSLGGRKPPPPSSQAQTQAELAEIRELKAELTKARADAAAAVALAAEREPPGLGGSVDRLRSRTAVAAMPRRPGASLANPNKAARRVTAIEFASDSDDG
ncbi:hypothetical protein BC827DRAFT_88648 [Russula dissimulans]|nr:hypothetical protein BC827DRAFT_88648 [Russula dissimulans]